jgi:putative ABC transport system permease protein
MKLAMGNVIKTTAINFIRKPITNSINLSGLAISLSLVVLLSIYSYSELTADHFLAKNDHVYVIDLRNGINTPGILKDLIDQNIPEVESTIRITGAFQTPSFQIDDNDPIPYKLIFTDDGFFNIFNYRAVSGELRSALSNPMSVVITKSMSEKMFGKELPIGKSIKMNNNYNLTVTAVIDDSRSNSWLTFDAICSNYTKKIVRPNGEEFTSWIYGNFQTCLLLKNGADPDETTKKIMALFPESFGTSELACNLVPFKELYFSKYSSPEYYLIYGDKRKVMLLLLVASLVLVIALVNFINISSSQWLEKVKQFGIMKIIGAKPSYIFRNIILAAFLLFLIALGLAILFIDNSYLQSYLGIRFDQRLIHSVDFLIASIGCIFILSCLFSLIPAWKISNSKAVDNLKKSLGSTSGRLSIRGILVTAQFIIAIVLIAFTLLIQRQVKFGNNILNQSRIIGIKLNDQLRQKKDVLKNILINNPIVNGVSFTQYYPDQNIQHWGTKLITDEEEKEINVDLFNADSTFFSIMDLQLIEGRFYNNNLLTDRGKVVVNETFLQTYNVNEPIGAKVIVSMDGSSSEIIGVVKDFHYKSMKQPISPLVIINGTHSFYCLVKVNTYGSESIRSALDNIKIAASGLSPAFPVEVSIFDQAVSNIYESEVQFQRIFSIYALFAILISSLGILAMSILSCQRRIKEICIRRIYWAKAIEIITMLNKDFIKWVAVAFIIAVPIAWFVMYIWLKNFAYKTNLSWWIFALSGIIAFGIASLTISWQSWRAASRNPIEILRYE